jgi:uncharacterized protein (DUF1697 family)
MQKYISMLRGINVSGQKKIKMVDLRALYESLDFKNVTTYIQSGNVVFQSEENDTTILAEKINDKIESVYGFRVPIIFRTHSDLDFIIGNNPFLTNRSEDIKKLAVIFLNEVPNSSALLEIGDRGPDSEELVISGKDLFLFVPESYGKSKWSNNFFEKKLGVKATTRNWNTVLKLHALSL